MPQPDNAQATGASAKASRLVNVLAFTCIVAGAFIVIAWIIGRIFCDRWIWSQWLLWLPTLVLLPSALLLAVGAAMARMPRRIVWTLCVASLLGPAGEVLGLWRPGSMPLPNTMTLRILHWTAGPQMRNTALLKQTMESTQADVVVVLGARRAAAGAALADWGTVPGPLARGEFMILSRVPVLRCRSLARSNNIQLVQLQVQPANAVALDLLLIDLPSSPTQSRWSIAQETRALIDTTLRTTPNLVFGDFNMTQGSEALRSILPGWAMAWPTSGVGWGGTWPRQMPLWRIDHVLVRPGDAMPTVTTLDPGEGRHRAQLIDIPLSHPH
jgi:hypothetical protein